MHASCEYIRRAKVVQSLGECIHLSDDKCHAHRHTTSSFSYFCGDAVDYDGTSSADALANPCSSADAVTACASADALATGPTAVVSNTCSLCMCGHWVPS